MSHTANHHSASEHVILYILLLAAECASLFFRLCGLRNYKNGRYHPLNLSLCNCRSFIQAQANKTEFFDRIYALDGSSDGEEETNETIDVLRRLLRPLSSFGSSSFQPPAEVLNTPIPTEKISSIHQTTSAPVSSSSVVKETPRLIRRLSLHPSETVTGEVAEVSVVNDTSLASPPRNLRPDTERRTVSNPIPGALVLTNSTGIAAMLGKKRGKEPSRRPEKRRRKEPSIMLVADDKRIFKDLTFYYIPPDDIAPLRRTRIVKATSHGATWTKEWILGITHVVVDKALTYKDVIVHLKPFLELDSLPSNVVLVNEDYPLDCISYASILDATQTQYSVKDHEGGVGEQTPSRKVTKKPDVPLEPKPAQPRKSDYSSPKQTPPRSQLSTQIRQSKTQSEQLLVDSSMRAWLPKEKGDAGFVVETPHEATGQQVIASEAQEILRPRDALDEVMVMARAVENLPLDDEEDDDENRPSSRDGPSDSGSDDQRREAPARAPIWTRRRDSTGATFNQAGFSCMTGGTGVSSSLSPNARTIELLQRMADHYDRNKDEWRSKAYRKAIGVLRKQTVKICTYKQSMELAGIGHRLALKIEEIVVKDRLRRLEYAQLESSDQILQLFLNIYGVGINLAQKWLEQGHKTLEDLKAHVHLTDNQRLGIDRYDDFLTHIPRDEVAALGVVVKRAATSIDPQVQVIIGGSYRRGASTSRDIDCLVTKPGTSSSRDLQQFLDVLTRHLTETGFLVAALSVSGSESGSKWHGVCVLPESTKRIWRRIDFLLVPETELGAALIYFTGDDIFNRSMRLLSSYKGMRLNQKGLYKNVMRGPGRDKISQGTLVEGADELKIFQALGVPWRPPQQRICH
jgi:DNA polymerase IV